MKKRFGVSGKSFRRLGAVCLLICILLSALCACGGRAPDPLAFGASDFAAELRGSMTTSETGACVEFTLKVEVRSAGELRALRVVCLSPEALADVEIEALCTRDGVPTGEATVRYGDLCIPTEAERLSGLLAPAVTLLSPRALASIRRTEDGWEASYEDGARILADGNGLPRAFFSPEISFEVVWYDARGVQ